MWLNKTSQQRFIQQRPCEVYLCTERRECLCSLHYFTAGAELLQTLTLWAFLCCSALSESFPFSCTSNGNQLPPPVNQLRRGRVHEQNHTISRWRRQWDSCCCQCHRVRSHLKQSGNMQTASSFLHLVHLASHWSKSHMTQQQLVSGW